MGRTESLGNAEPLAPAVENLSCSYCPQEVWTAHLLPGWSAGDDNGAGTREAVWITAAEIADGRSVHMNVTPPRAVRFACDDHNPGGYSFDVADWYDGPEHLHRPGERYTAR